MKTNTTHLLYKSWRFMAFFAALFFFSSAISSDGQSHKTLDIDQLEKNLEKNLRKYTLPNGLRIILLKNTTSPTIACYLKIGVGSSNEPFDQAGTAHFLEHLLFKGTHEIGTTDFAREKIYLAQIKSMGEKRDSLIRKLSDPLLDKASRQEISQEITDLERMLQSLQKISARLVISEEDSRAYSLAGQSGYNAYTSVDVTNYQVKLPVNRLELWAYMESSRFLNPVFREFYTERKVILEERRMRYDSNPSSLLYELFIKTAYGMSPYGKPVIGFASNILKLTQENTRQFFEKNYIPSRMVIAIAGDIDFDQTYAILEKYFSRLPAKKAAEFPPIETEPPLGQKTAELEVKHSPYMFTGWLKPSALHPDDVVYDVLEDILTSGQTSRLVKRLVIEEKLASAVSAYNGLPGAKLDNQFTIVTTPYKKESYSKIKEIINAELKKILEHGVTEEELTKIKNRALKDLIGGLSSNAKMADTLTFYEVIFHDYKKFFWYLKALQNVTSEDIQRVVGQTFHRKNNTTVTIVSPGH